MMKRSLLLSLFLAVTMFFVAACGNDNGTSNTQGANARPAPTRTAVSSDREVHVTLTDTTIQSSRLTFAPNVPYTFIVTNKGAHRHNFIIRKRPDVAKLTPQADNGIIYLIPSTQLPPGATKTFTYEFPQAQGAEQNNLQFALDLPGPNGSGVSIPVQVSRP